MKSWEKFKANSASLEQAIYSALDLFSIASSTAASSIYYTSDKTCSFCPVLGKIFAHRQSKELYFLKE